MCGACHGADGNSMMPNFPKLAGQGERYLLKQMLDIKSGARPVVPMTGMLDNMSEQDLQDIAAYFASQKMSVGMADAQHAGSQRRGTVPWWQAGRGHAGLHRLPLA